VKRLLRRVEITQEPDQRRADPARLGPVGSLQSDMSARLDHSFGRGFVKSGTGRTSIEPNCANGMTAASSPLR